MSSNPSKSNSSAASATDITKFNGHRLPNYTTLLYAMKLSLSEDKQISMDYWVNSLEQTACIGVRENDSKERLLVRSEEEYTSPIAKIYKAPAPDNTEYIIMTENTIYIVDINIPTRRVSM